MKQSTNDEVYIKYVTIIKNLQTGQQITGLYNNRWSFKDVMKELNCPLICYKDYNIVAFNVYKRGETPEKYMRIGEL